MSIDVLPAYMSVHCVHTVPNRGQRRHCIPLARVPVVLPEDLGSIASTLMAAHSQVFYLLVILYSNFVS